MLFSSVTFLFVFFPITLLAYAIAPKRLKNVVLLLASLVFYAWGEPVYIGLMLLSILLNYICGRDIYLAKEAGGSGKRELGFALAANLALLGFFKYSGFFAGIWNQISPVPLPYRKLALPIGISFYTFQAISYLIDIYRGEVKPQKHVMNFALYISMFPQLIAGPIVRYIDIDKQLAQRKESLEKFGAGARYFIIGLGKKVILANGIGAVFDMIHGSFLQEGTAYVLTAWIGAVAYALQIYFDFSGYSDMAIGLGKMFGFDFRRNFHYPYTSRSITEFWRRWHISLGTWFREYVYIPLGGNKKGGKRQIINLLIVWTLTGFWHGAAWNFLFWGLYYGVFLILEKFVWGNALERGPGWMQRIYTLAVVLIGWVFFFSDSLQGAIRYIGILFGVGSKGVLDSMSVYYLASNWLLFLCCIIGSTPAAVWLLNSDKYEGNPRWMALSLYAGIFLVALSCLVSSTFNPFLYFRF